MIDRTLLCAACMVWTASFWMAAPALRAQSDESLETFVVKADAPKAAKGGEAEAIESKSDAATAADAGTAEEKTENTAEKEAQSALQKEIDGLRKDREKIAAENALAQEQLRRELFSLEAEKQRLQLGNSLRSERLNAEMAEARTKLDKLNLEIDAVNKQTSFESAQRRAQLDAELAALRAEDERLRLVNSISSQRTEAQLAEMRLQEGQLKVERARIELDVIKLQSELTGREKNEILRDMVSEEQKYVMEPLQDGTLMISNRRIALNGVIVPAVADQVAERIDYFNNQNPEYPIFIVIDYSPGGSIMAGYKILKAMEGSRAPVYVVVKSYAASMAAVITTVAKRSFAYPNAVILHHQMSWWGVGNLTQQRELLDEAEQWWRRLAAPVAQKMGLTLDEFIKIMYQKNSDGDWREFADDAKKLKWVDEVVDRIWETALDKNPDRFGSRGMVMLQLEEKVDEQGAPYAVLPRLQPFDHYFLYNRDSYFRLR